jgi:Flp pilus assembly protein TadD
VDSACTLLRVLQLHKEWDDFPKGEEEALAALSAAMAKNPQDVEPLLRRGRFQANRGQWDKAAADFDRVVELRPQDARAWLERGRFHVQHGQRIRAAADFTQATMLSPEDVDLRLECARLRVIARDWPGAAADFRQAVNARPDDVPLRLECGEAEAWAGIWNRAAADFAFVVEKQPQEIQNWCNLALAQLGGGDRAAYRKTCAAMLARFGQSPDGPTLSQLYMICAATPDAKDAMREFAPVAGGLFRNVAYPPWFHSPLPAILYRAGKLPEAVAALDWNIRMWNRNKKAQLLEGLLLAMAHQRLGHLPQARDYLSDAETWMAAADKQEGGALGGARPAWPQWRLRVIVHALHDEAVALFKEGEKR